MEICKLFTLLVPLSLGLWGIFLCVEDLIISLSAENNSNFKVHTGGIQMSIKGILILILPIVLHIKGNIALPVLSMNSIIDLIKFR